VLCVRKKWNGGEVIRIRAKGQYLVRVKAKDKETACKTAAKEFALREGEERWLTYVSKVPQAASYVGI
jgi:hypothetical protein